MTASAEDDPRVVNLVVTNFSGGKRHRDKVPADREPIQEIAHLADNVRIADGFVLAVQEMTTDDPGLPTRVISLEAALGAKARSNFIPRVSTAWYPLIEKWGDKIEPGGSHNEGLCVVTGDSGLVLMPWSRAPWRDVAGPTSVTSPTRVLDLPNLSFRSTDPTEGSDLDEWFEASLEVNGVSESIYFRPAFYRGNRDSDPRVAQACLLAWSDKSDPNSYNPACVLVNIHLSTLTTELPDDRTIHGRLTSAEAIFLRGAQLDLIARYVREVQELADGIPTVIAGDFNAEPGSPEMIAFADKIGSRALLGAGICWKCGTLQRERPEVSFYAQSENGWDLTMNPQSPDGDPFEWKLDTRAVCSNDECLEVRFTHKWHRQLLDNVFVLPARGESSWEVAPGTPHVDLGWNYSDHAAIIVPLKFSKRFQESS